MIFALSNDNSIIHISNVNKGLACNCTCLNCGVNLIAKKGTVMMHHFSHYNVDECVGALETSLHIFAKNFISKLHSLRLPDLYKYLEFSYKGEYYNDEFKIFKSKVVSFEKVLCEVSYDNVIPDVVAYINDVPLFIEIAVTHFIDDEKREKIRSLGISTIEIDLSYIYVNIYNYSEDEIKEYIVDVLNKKWIYNRNEEAWAKKFINEKIILQEKKIKSLSIKLDQAISEFKNLKEIVWDDNQFYNNNSWEKHSHFLNFKTEGLPEYLNFKIDGDGIIEIDRRLWQTILFSVFINKYISKQSKKNKKPLFDVKIATSYLMNNVRIPFNKTLEYSNLLLKDSEDYPDLKEKRDELSMLSSQNSESISHLVYKFFNNLHNYGFLQIYKDVGHYFYALYEVTYEDLIV